jgi:hypothetical protein
MHLEREELLGHDGGAVPLERGDGVGLGLRCVASEKEKGKGKETRTEKQTAPVASVSRRAGVAAAQRGVYPVGICSRLCWQSLRAITAGNIYGNLAQP